MATIARRRSSRDEETEERNERDERPTRRRSRDSEPDEERPRRNRRGSSSRKDEDEGDERPSRSRRSRSRDDSGDEDEDRPRRGSRGRGSREGGSRKRAGSRGIASYQQKKRTNRTPEFKPWEENEHAWLIKIGEPDMFDTYNQHWIDDLPQGDRKSYVCFDDEYFADDDHYEDGCPLCGIGEPARTYSLWNIINLDNPDKPQVQVWSTPPTITDKLVRMSKETKTKPLNREDVYFEVVATKTKRKVDYTITPVKARDLEDDYDVEPLSAEELEEFEKDFFDDREKVTKVDDWEELADLADSL